MEQPATRQPAELTRYGANVREARVLIEPLRLIPPKHIFDFAKVMPPILEEVIDLNEPIATKQKTLGVPELAKPMRARACRYRFAFKELHSSRRRRVRWPPSRSSPSCLASRSMPAFSTCCSPPMATLATKS